MKLLPSFALAACLAATASVPASLTLRSAANFPLAVPTASTVRFSFENPQGNIVLVGTRSAVPGGVGTTFVRRLDGSGTVLSDQSFFPPGDFGGELIDATMDSGGTLTLLMWSRTGYSVTRLAWNGLLINSFRYVSSRGPNLPRAVRAVGTNGVVVLSWVSNGLTPSMRLDRIDASGNLVWSNTSNLGDIDVGSLQPLDVSADAAYYGVTVNGSDPLRSRAIAVRIDLSVGTRRWQSTFASGLGGANDNVLDIAAPRPGRNRVALAVAYGSLDGATRRVGAAFLNPTTGVVEATGLATAGARIDPIDVAFGPADGSVAILSRAQSTGLPELAVINESGTVTANGGVRSEAEPVVVEWSGTDGSNDHVAVVYRVPPLSGLFQVLWYTPNGAEVGSEGLGATDFRLLPAGALRRRGGGIAVVGTYQVGDAPSSSDLGFASLLGLDLRLASIDLVRGQSPIPGFSLSPVVDPAGNVTMVTISGSTWTVVRQSSAGVLRWRTVLSRLPGTGGGTLRVRADGDVFVVTNAVDRGPQLTRLNGATGAIRWTRPLLLPGFQPEVTHAEFARNGDLLLGGAATRGGGRRDTLVARVRSETAATVWGRLFDVPTREADVAGGLVELSGGNVVVSATSFDGVAFGWVGRWLRSSGELVRQVWEPSTSFAVRSVLADGLNRVVFAGTRTGGAHSDFEARMYTATGVPAWTAPFRYDFAARDDSVTDAVLDAAGTLTMVGPSITPARVQQAAVVRVRPNGTRQWVHRYASPSAVGDIPVSIAAGAAGSVWVAVDSVNGDTWVADTRILNVSRAGARTSTTVWLSQLKSAFSSPRHIGWAAPNQVVLVGSAPAPTTSLAGSPVVPWVVRYTQR